VIRRATGYEGGPIESEGMIEASPGNGASRLNGQGGQGTGEPMLLKIVAGWGILAALMLIVWKLGLIGVGDRE
jgi:hypothetical protein